MRRREGEISIPPVDQAIRQKLRANDDDVKSDEIFVFVAPVKSSQGSLKSLSKKLLTTSITSIRLLVVVVLVVFCFGVREESTARQAN